MTRSDIVSTMTGLLNNHITTLMEDKKSLSKIYFDDSPSKWGLDSKVISYMNSRGYPFSDLVGIMNLKSMTSAGDMHLYRLSNEDYEQNPELRKFATGSNVKVFRYATPNSVAGGIMPLIMFNFNRGLAYSLDDGEDGEIRFSSRGEKVNFARFIDTI